MPGQNENYTPSGNLFASLRICLVPLTNQSRETSFLDDWRSLGTLLVQPVLHFCHGDVRWENRLTDTALKNMTNDLKQPCLPQMMSWLMM